VRLPLRRLRRARPLPLAAALALFGCSSGEAGDGAPVAGGGSGGVPTFEVEPAWPQQLPNAWILGQVSGIAVDSRDHVWIVQRPSTLTPEEAGAAQQPPLGACCFPAPPVLEFDRDGRLVQAWGGPDAPHFWPGSEHGIYVDHNDFVWVGSNGGADHVVMKFTREGTLVLTLGVPGETGGSNDPVRLGGPAGFAVDPETNEIFIADGYVNRRVIVFDAETGAYRRHWGAYGNVPSDEPLPPYVPGETPPQQFRNPVHSVRVSGDGLVYVADRVGSRIQVFRRDGAFVREALVAPDTRGRGSVWGVELSADAQQEFL